MVSAFRHVALIGRYQSEGLGATLLEIAEMISEHGSEVLIEAQTAQAIGNQRFVAASMARIAREADLAISVGGDGTMLGVARSLASSRVQLVGINHGRLGFITDISLADWRTALSAILDGVYDAEDRILLSARAMRDGTEIWHDICLNDVVVSRSSRSGMIELQVDVDGVYMYNQRADGLIVATPTGSTAYALSANGPILHPELAGIVLVPIAPQALSNRPIALPDDVEVRIKVIEASEPRVSCDMQVFGDLQVGDEIIVRRAPFTCRFLHPKNHNHFATLRSKLNWHELPILQRPD